MSAAIAIVGMACEYPDARSPAELWDNVLACRRAFRRIPPERLNLRDYLSADRDLPDSIYSTRAALIEGYEFDRVHFRVAGRTYRSADLAHWLALDVAARALADAGFPEGEGLPAEATGVMVGNTLTGEFSRAQLMRLRWPYVRRVVAAELAAEGWSEARLREFLRRLESTYKQPYPEPTEETLAGGLSNTIAGRISNHFDLGGGGFTLDGACSSSLLAVAQACSALMAEDLEVAVAGGVDLSIDPFELVGFARTGGLAPGPMRVYDARSEGFIPGEGCGFVVLMRHADAVAQGRRVWAVIRGWGISSDGAGGITRPEVEGQKRALRRAYRRAGFDIATVGYFEGHGTGTAVGDATELAALSAARREADPAAPPVPVGSIKANIGHTKAAAGAAALIKATLAVQTQILPPNTGCEEPHPHLVGDDPALKILRRGEAWPRALPLRAGVSAMGFGGINAHVVLEGTGRERRRSLTSVERGKLASAQDAELVVAAGRDREELAQTLARLEELAARISQGEVADLAAEMARQTHGGRMRAAVVAAEPEELATGLATLREWLEGREPSQGHRFDARRGVFWGWGAATPRLGLLFPGQGAPSHLGGGLLARRFEEVESLYRRAALPADGDGVDTAVAQPAIVTACLAGLTLLQRLGIEASAALGHSLGELVALHWSGALGETELLELSRTRGQAMSELGGARGAMASLAAGPEVVEPLIRGEVCISGFNSPRQTVVSGTVEAVEELMTRARAQGLTATRLKVSHAFHSPQVAAAAEPLAAHLAGLQLGPLERPVASTVTGGMLAAAQDPRELLVRQVTSPVRFTDALTAAAERVDLWLEVGPGRVLAGLVEDTAGAPVISLDAGGPSLRGLLAAAAATFCLGAPVETDILFAGRVLRPFPLGWEPRFFVNPCELAPLSAAGPTPVVETLEEAPTWVSSLEERSPAAEVARAVEVSGISEAREETPLDLVRRLVASRAELPPETVSGDSRLLSDLHMNSISVGQLVVEAARGLGLSAPASPTDYANATVAEVAQALEELAALGPGDGEEREEGLPPGVAPWVRAFSVEWVEAPPGRPAAATGGGDWRLLEVEGQSLGPGLHRALADLGGRGLALCLPTDPRCCADLFLQAARHALDHPDLERFLMIQQTGGGGGFARTFHLELPRVTTCVVELPFDHPRAVQWAVAEMAAAHGYTEARYDSEGKRWQPVLRLLPLPEAAGEPALGVEDVLLVTGGGRGIGAECALALARASGARLALLGRSQPSESPELASNLERMAAIGVRALYLTADVTDPAAVTAAVDRAQAELGPVTAVLHSAGMNRPRPLTALDEESVRLTLAPKLDGLAHVLAAVDPERLHLLVTFGSIIARTGMKGEADYAVANEWLALATERFAREHPSCRCLTLEWSVWSGVGMGERLGKVEALQREGITPIPPDRGLEMLQRLLAAPETPVSVVVTGRFGRPPTLAPERRDLPLLRFLEQPRVHIPGVELVVDIEISGDSDPYLADHVFHGERLFPAVLGLEAMAQVAMAVTGSVEPPVFEDVELPRPVVVPEGETATLRVVSLVREEGRVDVALRAAATGFAADHFHAVCRFPGEGRPDLGTLQTADATAAPRCLPLSPETDLYGGILFQRGRFRRLSAYRELKARECVAEIAADGAVAWFARHLPPDLVLGDPAARDAVLHGLQPSVPHATLLPVGVERLCAGVLVPTDGWLLSARERRRDGDLFVYDVEVVGADGRVVERWEGLRLKAVERLPPPAAWRAPLLGPYVERCLQELIPGMATQVLVERREGGEARSNGRSAASDPVIRRLLGGEDGAPVICRRPDGKPEVPGGCEVSVAHAGSLVLAVAGSGPVGCDLEPVVARPLETWRDLLGSERLRLVERIAAEKGGGRDAAATRVWAAMECLKKAGAPTDAPLLLGKGEVVGPSATAERGWLLLTSGDLAVGTLVAPVEGVSEPMALAVLTRGERPGP